jgi:hypothetical protein
MVADDMSDNKIINFVMTAILPAAKLWFFIVFMALVISTADSFAWKQFVCSHSLCQPQPASSQPAGQGYLYQHESMVLENYQHTTLHIISCLKNDI